MKKYLLILLVVLALTLVLISCGEQEQATTTLKPEPPIHIHNYADWDIVKNPTCTENGEKVRYCACGEKQSEIVVALGHIPAEAIEENRVEATCYAEGRYDNVVYCSTCKAELERATFTLSKVEHTPANAVEENRVNPTHEKDGSYQMVVYCSVAECHAELERTTHTLDMLVHHPGNAVVENITNGGTATLSADEWYTFVYTKGSGVLANDWWHLGGFGSGTGTMDIYIKDVVFE